MNVLILKKKVVSDLTYCLAFLKNRSCEVQRKQGTTKEEFEQCEKALYARFGEMKLYKEGIKHQTLMIDESFARAVSQSCKLHLGYRPSRKNVLRILSHLASEREVIDYRHALVTGKSLSTQSIKESVMAKF